MQSRLEALRS
uniref:Uncharacterized protein n=1 Tax=Anguilla anguilla TaxID=7936 RepID=A0A0E9SIZ1_ANGAN